MVVGMTDLKCQGKVDICCNRGMKEYVSNLRAPLGDLIGLLYQGIKVNEKLQSPILVGLLMSSGLQK